MGAAPGCCVGGSVVAGAPLLMFVAVVAVVRRAVQAARTAAPAVSRKRRREAGSRQAEVTLPVSLLGAATAAPTLRDSARVAARRAVVQHQSSRADLGLQVERQQQARLGVVPERQ
jgi:hypothetical protein